MRKVFNTPRLRRFWKQDNASLSLEAVLVIPFLMLTFIALFTIVDAFRAIHSNSVSTFSIGDALSRETDIVTAAYIEGLNDLHELMARADSETDMRISVVHYDEASDSLIMDWSYATANRSALTQSTVIDISPNVPTLDDDEAVVIVETWVQFTPFSSTLLSNMEIQEIVVTRPRYAPTVAWQS